MSIPWKTWGTKAREHALRLIRATPPGKGQAHPPPESTPDAAFDRWKNAKPLLMVGALALAAPPADTGTGGTVGDTVVVPPLPAPQGVELPRMVPTVPASLATADCTVTIKSNLQAALNAARAGDVLCLSGTFTGDFTLPARPDRGWVVVRSLASVAAPGERMRPSLAAPLAVVRGIGQAPTFATKGASRGWYLRELNIAADSIPATVWTLVDFRPRASELVLDRVWVHPPTDRQTQRCVALNSGAATVIDSWLGECHIKGFDSQAIWGFNGPGPYLIQNNTLEGVGENLMFGGADPRVAGLVPSDITIRRNHLVSPVSWRGRWTKKNLLELKNARRVLIEENVLDGSWPDGQTGIAVMIRSSNQGGKCRWCGSSDITIRRNLLVNVAGAFALFGGASDANPVDSVTRRVLIEENYAEVGGPAVGMDNRLNLYLSKVTDATLRRNTFQKTPANVGNAFTGADPGASGPVRLTIDRDVYPRGAYGIMGQWSATAAPGLSVRGLAIVGGTAPIRTVPNVSIYPTLAAALAAGFGVSRATIAAATAGVVVLP